MLTILLADLVDRNNIRMFQLCGGFCFGEKMLNLFLSSELTSQDHLECNLAFQASMTSQIDDSHSATRNFAEEFVVSQFGKAIRVTDNARRFALTGQNEILVYCQFQQGVGRKIG